MAQKIDVHGIFIDPEAITGLQLEKRKAVYFPVFYEVRTSKTLLGRVIPPRIQQKHILRFDHQQPYGIILADAEQYDPSSHVVSYQDAAIERFLRGLGKASKSLIAHVAEQMKIDFSGDRRFRVLLSGRDVKETTIREIPAKVKLLNGQWVDAFKSSPEYDFQGGTPYAVTGEDTCALMIGTKERVYALFGAGVDAADGEVEAAYQRLTELYNQIQAARDAAPTEEPKQEPLLQSSPIVIQLPKVELPKEEIPIINLTSPEVVGRRLDAAAPKAIEDAASDPETAPDK